MDQFRFSTKPKSKTTHSKASQGRLSAKDLTAESSSSGGNQLATIKLLTLIILTTQLFTDVQIISACSNLNFCGFWQEVLLMTQPQLWQSLINSSLTTTQTDSWLQFTMEPATTTKFCDLLSLHN